MKGRLLVSARAWSSHQATLRQPWTIAVKLSARRACRLIQLEQPPDDELRFTGAHAAVTHLAAEDGTGPDVLLHLLGTQRLLYSAREVAHRQGPSRFELPARLLVVV